MQGYFEGWYYKSQSKNHTVAVIPSRHTDAGGKQFASIQLITDQGAWRAHLPYQNFHYRRKDHFVQIEKNLFHPRGLALDLHTDEVTATGNLTFGHLVPLPYDIMGPFRYVPMMECRHSIVSMAHTVHGHLNINGIDYPFEQGRGYIEGDRGRSFPSVYAWTQCLFEFPGEVQPNSVMLSVADIPLGFLRFTGVIGVILWRGRQYRIATYWGARALRIGNGEIIIRQGSYQLTARLVHKQAKPLYAPVSGDMTRIIHESPSCTAYYHFQKDGNTLFECVSPQAAFEYEYDR